MNFQSLKAYFFNPLDRILKQAASAQKNKFLILWNRGLGDIPLGLYALVLRMKQLVPSVMITFLTRLDLQEGFEMLPGVQVLIDPEMKRGQTVDIEKSLTAACLRLSDFDFILSKVDPTRWLAWQVGKITPKLSWQSIWDELSDAFGLPKSEKVLGIHVSSETAQFYKYRKDWPLKSWQALIDEMQQTPIVLFGLDAQDSLVGKNIIDLRGRTSLLQMLSIIKNNCHTLIAPDSGVLSMTYYIDTFFPLKIISLWADPKQGILRQNVASPNLGLVHIPLKGQGEDVSTISVDDVINAMQ